MRMFLSLLLIPVLAFGADTGEICVSDVEVHPKNDIFLMMGLGRASVNYAVQIDDGPVVELSEEASTHLTGFSLNEKHLVKIFSKGKLEQSFWHKFENHSAYCLWYKSLYSTWSIWPSVDSKHLCNCGAADQDTASTQPEQTHEIK